jgi:peptidoglycan/LPS O-acetylase OafA/YrhL
MAIERVIDKRMRFNSLDSLRGIAALLIVVFHVQGIPRLEVTGGFAEIITHFGAGVPLFYALSAFSLMIGYSERLESPGGLKHFYIRRIFRILPLFYGLLIFWILVRNFYFQAETSFTAFVLNYLCVLGLIPGQHEGLVWASWSIGVEMLFYLIFPLALIISRTLASSFIVFLATVAISVASQDALSPLADKAPSFPHMAISTQIVFFGAGLFAYRLGEYLAARTSESSETMRRTFAEVIVISGIGFLLAYWMTPLSVWAGRIHLGVQMLAFAWVLLLAPVLVQGRLNTISIRPLERAGKISFSLYLLNPPIIFFLSQTGVFKKIYGLFTIPNVAFVICLVVSLCLLYIFSKITYYFIEEKGILLGNELLAQINADKGNETGVSRTPLISMNNKLIISFAALPFLVWCVVTLVTNTSHNKDVSGQSIKPKIEHVSTQKLWKCLSPQDLLTADDNLKLLENGIRIHPGGNPKTATFLVDGKFKQVELVSFIDVLPQSALSNVEAATAGVEVFLDDKSQGRRLVTRNIDQTFILDLTQTKVLKIVVDCANGTAAWDWVNIGIK